MKALLVLLFSFSMSMHDFHVSIAQVDYKEEELQCTLRLFTDDLEQRLELDHQVKLNLGGANQHPKADEFIAAFLKENFKIEQGDSSLQQVYLGIEVEYELVYLYFYYPCPNPPQQLGISNRVFFDSFDDQSNIVNVKVGEKLRSAFLNSSSTEQILQF